MTYNNNNRNILTSLHTRLRETSKEKQENNRGIAATVLTAVEADVVSAKLKSKILIMIYICSLVKRRFKQRKKQ